LKDEGDATFIFFSVLLPYLRGCRQNKLPCQPAGEYSGFGEPNPGFRDIGQAVVMHDQAAGEFVPGVGTLDYPPFRQHGEAGRQRFGEQIVLTRLRPPAYIPIRRMANDFHRNAVLLLDRSRPLPGVSRIDKQALHGRVLGSGTGDRFGAGIAVLQTGGTHADSQDEPQGIDDEITFAAFNLFAGIVPEGPPCGELRVLCASKTAALGFASRPSRTRHICRRRSCMASKRPWALQRRKVL
jgi:hypothetical protein